MAFERKQRQPDGSFSEPRKIGAGDTPTEIIARLEQEKQVLLAGMMEMSAIAAAQQQTIDQQNSAIMELSLLVATTTGGSE